MRRRWVTATLLAVVTSMAACGTREDPVVEQVGEPRVSVEPVGQAESPLSFEGAEWDGWTGEYTDVRPVTDEAVAGLVARVEALNQTSWTAVEATAGAEIAYTPGHVRLTAGEVAVHLDPRLRDDDDGVLALCVAGGECVGGEEAEDFFDEPLLFTQLVPAFSAVVPTQLAAADEVDDVLDEGIVSLATVASPVGDLECLVHVFSETDVAALEGTELVLADNGDDEVRASFCVDERGLVVIGPGGSTGALYSAWAPGVDGDVTALVPPVAEPTAEPEPGGELDQVFWGSWEPVYADLRPATQGDVDALRDRALDLASREWTMVDATYGTETAYTPERVRISIDGLLGAYADPRDDSEPWNFVICSERACTDTRKLAENDAPHLTGSMTDGMIYSALAAAKSQAAPMLELGEHTVLATVDSPVGLLDCVVTGARAMDVDPGTLEGTPMVLDLSQVADPDVGPFVSPICVDSRGLVVGPGAGFLPWLPVASWHEGVEGSLDPPFPVKR